MCIEDWFSSGVTGGGNSGDGTTLRRLGRRGSWASVACRKVRVIHMCTGTHTYLRGCALLPALSCCVFFRFLFVFVRFFLFSFLSCSYLFLGFLYLTFFFVRFVRFFFFFFLFFFVFFVLFSSSLHVFVFPSTLSLSSFCLLFFFSCTVFCPSAVNVMPLQVQLLGFLVFAAMIPARAHTAALC